VSPASAVRLVVTDLDGTLLDEDTYDLGPARPALDELAARGVPLVLCSSKSRAEMQPLVARLGLRSPFIVENGGAIVFPDRGSGGLAGAPADDTGAVVALGAPRRDLLAALPGIALDAGARVRSFDEMSDAEVAALTGLSESDAALARRREWDEPFVAHDAGGGFDLDARLEAAARRRGLRVTKGGRLHHLTGPTDKGVALRALLRFLPAGGGGRTVGLGDAANDLPMLRVVDRPILMPRAGRGVCPVLAAALPDAVHAPAPGPAGWAAAVLATLGEPVAPRER